jgi:hypothetical protein
MIRFVELSSSETRWMSGVQDFESRYYGKCPSREVPESTNSIV